MAFRLQRISDGSTLLLDERAVLGAGGESVVYFLPDDPTLAAKVYLKAADDKGRKLQVMAANPPEMRTDQSRRPEIAWPVDLLQTTGRKKRVAGFLMPRVEGMAPIIDFYSPHTRLLTRPWFDYSLLLKTGANLAGAVEAVHAAGYVIGDLSHSNVLVADDGRVTLIDTDSFQVRGPAEGELFYCPVYTPDFTAPELHRRGLTVGERSVEQDSFSLGVLVYLLLMGGVHPFTGVYLGQGESPPLFDRIAAGDFPYRRATRSLVSPPAMAVPMETLAPGIRELMYRCMEEGDRKPEARPAPSQWRAELEKAEDDLIICSRNERHRFGGHTESCPWCQRTEQLGGRDPFPSAEAVANGRHRRPIPVRQTLSPRRVPQWRVQERKMRAARFQTGTSMKTWHWAVLVAMLWAGLPGLWSISAWHATVMIPFVAVLASFFYLMSCAMVAVAVGVIGWRRATSPRLGGRWLVASAFGLPVGVGLIGMSSLLAFY